MAYRLTYQVLENQNTLQQEAASYCEETVRQAATTMPSNLKAYFESQTAN